MGADGDGALRVSKQEDTVRTAQRSWNAQYDNDMTRTLSDFDVEATEDEEQVVAWRETLSQQKNNHWNQSNGRRNAHKSPPSHCKENLRATAR